MITVPKYFQFRIKDEPGYTHTGKIENDACEVKWARGFDRYYMNKTGTTVFPVTEWSVQEVAGQFVNKWWVLADQPEAKQEDALPDRSASLPDEFYIQSKWLKNIWRVVKVEGGYNFYMPCGNVTQDSPLDGEFIKDAIKDDYWTIINKPPLTAEQLRSNAEAREQISALEHNIKLRKQDVEHAQILIKNYEGRVKELESKIVEEF